MLANLEDRGWQLRNEFCSVQRISQPKNEIIAREVYSETFACWGSRIKRDRCAVQVSDKLIENCLEVRVGRITM